MATEAEKQANEWIRNQWTEQRQRSMDGVFRRPEPEPKPKRQTDIWRRLIERARGIGAIDDDAA
jgi:hypothetical protein